MRMWSGKVDSLQVASGTIYNEVIDVFLAEYYYFNEEMKMFSLFILVSIFLRF